MQSARQSTDNQQIIPSTGSLPRCIGIIGLGLIGGSLARAFKRRAGIERIIAYDVDAAGLQSALNEGVADETHLIPDEPYGALSQAEMVFLCTPVETIVGLAETVCAICPGLVTDVASTKAAICSAVKAANFIGGHPMAGSERVGFGASSEGLFENAVYVLCQPDERLMAVIRAIGAFPLCLSPQEHDQAVAAISHLPHVAASALTLLAARSDRGTLSRLAAGGFRDITRIASSDAGLWASICLSARPALMPLIEDYRSALSDFERALEQNDRDTLYQLFAQAADYRNSLPIDGRGAMESMSTLTVHLPDRPGELGKVTTLLGDHQINIRNMRIRDFRTYEGGVLQILLPDSRQVCAAAALLKEAGYATE